MTEKHLFQETEQLAGHIIVDSGSLLITDGIWDSPGISKANKIKLDLDEDKRLKVPVTTVLQNGRRFIILDVDGAVEVSPVTEKVDTEDEVEVPEEEPAEIKEEAPTNALRIPKE